MVLVITVVNYVTVVHGIVASLCVMIVFTLGYDVKVMHGVVEMPDRVCSTSSEFLFNQLSKR